MKVFVWNRIEKASDNYHEEGGLVVFAESLEKALQLANAIGAHPTQEEAPDEIRECKGDEKAYVMPDAGCC